MALYHSDAVACDYLNYHINSSKFPTCITVLNFENNVDSDQLAAESNFSRKLGRPVVRKVSSMVSVKETKSATMNIFRKNQFSF